MAAVERNRAKGRPATYEALTMPEETRLYVPKLQALRNIISNPRSVRTDSGSDTERAVFRSRGEHAEAGHACRGETAEIPFDEFAALNPALNGSVISAAEVSHILLPVEKVEVFQQNVQSMSSPSPRQRVPQVRRVLGAAPSLTPDLRN